MPTIFASNKVFLINYDLLANWELGIYSYITWGSCKYVIWGSYKVTSHCFSRRFTPMNDICEKIYITVDVTPVSDLTGPLADPPAKESTPLLQNHLPFSPTVYSMNGVVQHTSVTLDVTPASDLTGPLAWPCLQGTPLLQHHIRPPSKVISLYIPLSILGFLQPKDISSGF